MCVLINDTQDPSWTWPLAFITTLFSHTVNLQQLELSGPALWGTPQCFTTQTAAGPQLPTLHCPLLSFTYADEVHEYASPLMRKELLCVHFGPYFALKSQDGKRPRAFSSLPPSKIHLSFLFQWGILFHNLVRPLRERDGDGKERGRRKTKEKRREKKRKESKTTAKEERQKKTEALSTS